MAGRLVALRAAGRIAARDARRSKGRTALVATMIGLPLLIGTAGGTLLNSLEPTPEQVLDARLGETAQAEISAHQGSMLEQELLGEYSRSMGYGNSLGQPGIAEHEQSLAAVLPAGSELVRVTTGGAMAASEERPSPYYSEIYEIPAERLTDLLSVPVTAGRLPQEPGELLVSARQADFFGLSIGDALRVTVEEEVTGTVVGILEPALWAPDIVALPGTMLPEPANATGRWGEVQPRWYVFGDDPVTWETVEEINVLGSFVLSRHVVHNPETVTSNSYTDLYIEPQAVAIVAVVIAIVLIEAVLLIGPAFAVGAQRSQRQLAMLAATGGDARTLRRVVLFGGVTTGLAASTLAVALGLALAGLITWGVNLARPFTIPALEVPWPVFPAVIALGTLLATAAAWLPARRAGRLDVVAALAGRRAEARPRRRVAIIGAVIAGIGVVAAIAGAASSNTVLVVAGVLALEVGIVATAGAIIALVARLAPRFGVAGRFALRDSARQRARSAPAVAAIIAALAGATAGAGYIASSEVHRDANYIALGPEGTVVAGIHKDVFLDPDDLSAVSSEQLDGLDGALRATLPVEDVFTVSMATPLTDEQILAGSYSWRSIQWPGGNFCPLNESTSPSNAELREHVDDPRCRVIGYGSGSLSPRDSGAVVVDDGTLLAGLGFPGADEAAAALADGRVVVASHWALHPDDTVHLEAEISELIELSLYGAEYDNVHLGSFELPATVIELGTTTDFDLVFPPQVVEELGWRTEAVALMASTTRIPTSEEERAARDATSELSTSAHLDIERGPQGESAAVWIVVGAALIVGLGATFMSIALAQAETRPDLATLAAVGASPGVRRRIAAAQAGVLTLIGAVLGTGTGLLLTTVIVSVVRYQYGQYDPTWELVIPWPAVAAIGLGVPLLATSAAWLVTRSRLPMVRRIAA